MRAFRTIIWLYLFVGSKITNRILSVAFAIILLYEERIANPVAYVEKIFEGNNASYRQCYKYAKEGFDEDKKYATLWPILFPYRFIYYCFYGAGIIVLDVPCLIIDRL